MPITPVPTSASATAPRIHERTCISASTVVHDGANTHGRTRPPRAHDQRSALRQQKRPFRQLLGHVHANVPSPRRRLAAAPGSGVTTGARSVRAMKVALTVNDFLRRAELLYPDREAIADEPDQPAESWGSVTYREMARRATALAAGLDALGVGVGERVAMVSHNSARLLTALFGVSGSGRVLVPINFRLVAEEVKYIVAHSGATVLLIDPELEHAMAERRVRDEVDDRRRRATRSSMRFDTEPAAVGGRRGRHRHDQLHVAAPRPARRACSSPTATSG